MFLRWHLYKEVWVVDEGHIQTLSNACSMARTTKKFNLLKYHSCCVTSHYVSKAGMPMGSHKKRGTTFCGKLDGELPLLVRSFKDPPILSELIFSDLDKSQESIFWCKKADFRSSAEDWHPCKGLLLVTATSFVFGLIYKRCRFNLYMVQWCSFNNKLINYTVNIVFKWTKC